MCSNRWTVFRLYLGYIAKFKFQVSFWECNCWSLFRLYLGYLVIFWLYFGYIAKFKFQKSKFQIPNWYCILKKILLFSDCYTLLILLDHIFLLWHIIKIHHIMKNTEYRVIVKRLTPNPGASSSLYCPFIDLILTQTLVHHINYIVLL